MSGHCTVQCCPTLHMAPTSNNIIESEPTFRSQDFSSSPSTPHNPLLYYSIFHPPRLNA